ncbi:MAG: hypothetical protein AAF518_25350, partial [Spirochaetota bacterium]
MNILLYTICFLFFPAALAAKPSVRPTPSETEVYLFGFIMFVSAMGTLLLLIFILSKIQEKINPASIYQNDPEPSPPVFKKQSGKKKAFIEKVKVFLRSEESKSKNSAVNPKEDLDT